MSLIRRRIGFWLAVVFTFVSCQTDRHLVANTTASYIWANAQYRKACVGTKGPETCKQRYLDLNDTLDDTTVANQAQAIGKLPKGARKKLKRDMKKLEAPL